MRKLVVFLVALLTAPFWALSQSINFTSVPPPGTSGLLYGNITEVENPETYKLALVIDVFGSLWSKPTFANPSIAISTSGTFAGQFITGGQDLCASRIHAFLVPIDYTIPLVGGGSQIPQDLINTAIAYAVAERAQQETFPWLGYTWTFKDTGDCIWGPGPNYFSKDCVRIDEQGKLRLSVRYIDGRWRCAEIILTESLGYGTYRFYIDSDLSDLPDPIVFGAFTYDDDAAFSHREIDIEFSNGVVVGRNAPWQFVVQPYTITAQRRRFVGPDNLVKSTHTFTWLPGIASFASYANHPMFSETYHAWYDFEAGFSIGGYWFPMDELNIPVKLSVPGKKVVYDEHYGGWRLSDLIRARLLGIEQLASEPAFESWSSPSGVPPTGSEKIHINLWLFEGEIPGSTDQVYEVVIEKFEFVPISDDFIESLRPSLKISDVTSSRDTGTTMKLEMAVPAEE